MPSKKELAGACMTALPSTPKELIDQLTGGTMPMTAVQINATTMALQKALIERALGAELSPEVTGLLSSWSYDVPNIIDASQVHEYIRAAKAKLDGVLRNFEKVRWASANTSLEFNEWLVEHGHPDLVQG